MDQVGLEIPLEAGYSANGESGEYGWTLDIFEYRDTGENPHSVELAELTGIDLLQVDLEITWGTVTEGTGPAFSTVRAVLANRGLER